MAALYKIRSSTFENRKITLHTIFSPAINSFILTLCAKDKSLIGFGTLHKENNDYLDELKKLSEFVPNDIDRRKIEYYNYIDFLKKYSDERK